MPHAGCEEYTALLYALCFKGHDPKIAFGLINHTRDHSACAEVYAKLNSDQDDREQDADQRHSKPDTIVK